MRQTDPQHCPSGFLARYPEIGFIIDISNDTPPYRASDFENSRVEYIKLRTVSKIPPRREDVQKFIEVAEQCWQRRPDAQIAVHCHYGYVIPVIGYQQRKVDSYSLAKRYKIQSHRIFYMLLYDRKTGCLCARCS